MNRLLALQFDKYIALNPMKVNSVFNQYGISSNTPINVQTVVEAYQYFKEPFAVDLFNALYPEIKQNMTIPSLSNLETTAVTNDPNTAVKTSFWDGFSQALDALAKAAPVIAQTIAAAKGTTSATTTNGVQTGGVAAQADGINKNILIYIGLGFVAVITAVVLFKKL